MGQGREERQRGLMYVCDKCGVQVSNGAVRFKVEDCGVFLARHFLHVLDAMEECGPMLRDVTQESGQYQQDMDLESLKRAAYQHQRANHGEWVRREWVRNWNR